METNYFTFVIIIAVVAEVVAAFYLIRNRRLYQLISQTETSKIANVRNGFYEIKGKVLALAPPLITPFSKKACVYFDFLVEEKRSNGKSSHWAKYIEDVKFQKFGVDDGSGVAIVDCEGAKMKLLVDRKEQSGLFNKADENQKEVLSQYGKRNKGLLFEKTIRYREKFLEEGDEVIVLGEVNSRDDLMPLFKKVNQPMLVSDKPEQTLASFYKNRIAISIAVMIIVVLGLVVFSTNML